MWPLALGGLVVAGLFLASRRPSGGMVYFPLDSCTGCTTSLYGLRNSPVAEGAPLVCHRGIDLGARSGATVRAALPGVVRSSRFSETGGNLVVIEHGEDLETHYLHMSKRDVDAGDTVMAGAKIGEVGSTGLSTGPHLHFAVKDEGRWIDPGPMLGLPAGRAC